MSTPESSDPQPLSDADIKRIAEVAAKFRWVAVVNNVGGLICSLWLLYVAFTIKGILATVLVFFLLGALVYPMGTAPMFAVSASVLSFYFGVVGAWLPIVSYITAALALYIDLRLDRVRRTLFPF